MKRDLDEVPNCTSDVNPFGHAAPLRQRLQAQGWRLRRHGWDFEDGVDTDDAF